MELALGERGTPAATAARPWGFEEDMMGEYGCFHKWVIPKMDGLQWEIPLRWMIRGTPSLGNLIQLDVGGCQGVPGIPPQIVRN